MGNQVEPETGVVILSVEYDPGTMSAPAFLDLYLEGGRTVTLQGRAARKLSKLKPGDLYHESA
jgi:hypothetical protein